MSRHRTAPQCGIAALLFCAVTAPVARGDEPAVGRPIAEVFETVDPRDREAAVEFYAKHIDAGGVPVLASAAVDDAALLRTRELVTHLLARRPDVLRAMADHGTRLIVIGRDQVYTDMPEYRRNPNPDYMNERVRGTGGFDVTSFGEENLLDLPIDRYDDESIAVHEFCHTIEAAIRSIDPAWGERLDRVFGQAMDRGLWHQTYAASNAAEYWAEICQCYFDCNRVNNWNHGPIGSREQLKDYDREGYELVRTTFALTPETDWRFRPVRPAPLVIVPPAKFDIDPYYEKFTYARELPVVGSGRVSDEALLRANDVVRKLFAYRHDVLKAIINDGGRLVVLARGERLSELPELRGLAASTSGWDDARYRDYADKIMVVPEENLMGDADDPLAGAGGVVRAMARAAFRVTAGREVDPAWDDRPRRLWQQYELRVQRLDTRLSDELRGLQELAAGEGRWRGTPAAEDLEAYWSAGVEAYFDAAGSGVPPVGAARPIVTREQLRDYDPGLFAVVDRVFAYGGRVDWRHGGE